MNVGVASDGDGSGCVHVMRWKQWQQRINNR